jgi:hypothetical protein
MSLLLILICVFLNLPHLASADNPLSVKGTVTNSGGVSLQITTTKTTFPVDMNLSCGLLPSHLVQFSPTFSGPVHFLNKGADAYKATLSADNSLLTATIPLDKTFDVTTTHHLVVLRQGVTVGPDDVIKIRCTCESVDSDAFFFIATFQIPTPTQHRDELKPTISIRPYRPALPDQPTFLVGTINAGNLLNPITTLRIEPANLIDDTAPTSKWVYPMGFEEEGTGKTCEFEMVIGDKTYTGYPLNDEGVFEVKNLVIPKENGIEFKILCAGLLLVDPLATGVSAAIKTTINGEVSWTQSIPAPWVAQHAVPFFYATESVAINLNKDNKVFQLRGQLTADAFLTPQVKGMLCELSADTNTDYVWKVQGAAPIVVVNGVSYTGTITASTILSFSETIIITQGDLMADFYFPNVFLVSNNLVVPGGSATILCRPASPVQALSPFKLSPEQLPTTNILPGVIFEDISKLNEDGLSNAGMVITNPIAQDDEFAKMTCQLDKDGPLIVVFEPKSKPVLSAGPPGYESDIVGAFDAETGEFTFPAFKLIGNKIHLEITNYHFGLKKDEKSPPDFSQALSCTFENQIYNHEIKLKSPTLSPDVATIVSTLKNNGGVSLSVTFPIPVDQPSPLEVTFNLYNPDDAITRAVFSSNDVNQKFIVRSAESPNKPVECQYISAVAIKCSFLNEHYTIGQDFNLNFDSSLSIAYSAEQDAKAPFVEVINGQDKIGSAQILHPKPNRAAKPKFSFDGTSLSIEVENIPSDAIPADYKSIVILPLNEFILHDPEYQHLSTKPPTKDLVPIVVNGGAKASCKLVSKTQLECLNLFKHDEQSVIKQKVTISNLMVKNSLETVTARFIINDFYPIPYYGSSSAAIISRDYEEVSWPSIVLPSNQFESLVVKDKKNALSLSFVVASGNYTTTEMNITLQIKNADLFRFNVHGSTEKTPVEPKIQFNSVQTDGSISQDSTSMTFKVPADKPGTFELVNTYVNLKAKSTKTTDKPVVIVSITELSITDTERTLQHVPTRFEDFKDGNSHAFLIVLVLLIVIAALGVIIYKFVWPRFAKKDNDEELLYQAYE